MKLEIIKKIGDGEILKLKDGRKIFKLSSFKENPIIKPFDFIKNTENAAIFNGGVAFKDKKVYLFPRVHKNYLKKKFFDENLKIERTYMENYISEIWEFESEDGVNFRKTEIKIKGDGSEHKDFIYGIEDIRVTKYKDEYFLIGCGKIKPPFKGKNGDRTAIYLTEDFKNIKYCGIIKEFDSRNTVPLFIENKIYLFFRFHPNIYLYEIDDIEKLMEPRKFSEYWKKIYEEREKYILLKAGTLIHEREKVGAGPPPILTEKGILFIYHSVGKIEKEITEIYGLKKEIIRGYSVNAVLLDYENPYKIIAKTELPIYIPHKPWEYEGDSEFEIDVPYVVFPTGIISIDKKIIIYAGAGDKYMVILSADLDYLLDFLLKN